MIKINIVKLPPEAEALAREIEDTLAQMVSKTVKSMVGVDNNLENLEITVYEALRKLVTEQPVATTMTIPEPGDSIPFSVHDNFPAMKIVVPRVAKKEADELMDDCINLFVTFSDPKDFEKEYPKCARVIKHFQGLDSNNERKGNFQAKLAAAKKKEEERRSYPVG